MVGGCKCILRSSSVAKEDGGKTGASVRKFISCASKLPVHRLITNIIQCVSDFRTYVMRSSVVTL
jgi:hypothetical protein